MAKNLALRGSALTDERLRRENVIDDVGHLLVRCPDQHGIVAAISGFLLQIGANIVTSDQYSTDPEGGTFFLRIAFNADGLAARRFEVETAFSERVARPFAMDWRMAYPAQKKRVALLASRHDHCLLDLLWRWRRTELDAEVVAVVSNHRDVERDVATFDVPFYHVPVDSRSRATGEAAILELLAGVVDLVVLARYMQILSRSFLADIAAPVINIHHSFLPAFVGASPYERAHERGVKLIGATAHYVTEDLDEGPIIEQDVIRVSHRHNGADLERIGRDIERVVLARAVQSHLDDRVVVHANRTVVF